MDAAGLFPISHTKVQSFRRCRKQYWFEYVSGLPKPPKLMNAAGIVGSAVHAAMKVLTESGSRRAGKAALDAYLAMPAHECAGPETDWFEQAGAMFEQGCAFATAIRGSDCWAEKETYAFSQTRGIRLYVKADRIDRLDDTTWQVTDWKTGRYLDDDVVTEQLRLAHVALRSTLRLSCRAEHVVRAVAVSLRPEADPPRVMRLTREHAAATMDEYGGQAVRMQATTDWSPSPGPHCRLCTWQNDCPVAEIGGAVGDWDNLEDDEADATLSEAAGSTAGV